MSSGMKPMIAVAATALLALSACSSSGGGSAKSGAPAASNASATITIKQFAFTGDLTVKPGAIVKVVDADSAAHTLADKNGKFDTGNIDGGGGTKTFTAPKAAGSYQLICAYHASMHGTLTVKG